MIDLHCHSTCSDGSFRPSELVELALQEGVEALALTDHDTMAGWEELRAAAEGTALRVVPGVEVSADFPGETPHILGYGVARDCLRFNEMLERLRGGRETRNRSILERMEGLGVPVEWHEVVALSGGGVIGRPHIAQAMVARGYVRNTKKAFDRFLGRGAAAYVDRFRYSPEEVIEGIHAAGGVAVLAHPGCLKMGRQRLTGQLALWAGAGLDGIETYYPDHTPAHQSFYETMAVRFGLIPTGGSDFHGKLTPHIRLGRARAAELVTPPDTVDRLLARSEERRAALSR
jgi:predicted metal-dependent phosphoesterase TrpH